MDELTKEKDRLQGLVRSNKDSIHKFTVWASNHFDVLVLTFGKIGRFKEDGWKYYDNYRADQRL